MGRADGHASARAQRAHGRGEERVVQPGRHPHRHRQLTDRTAKVWDARTGTPLLELKGTRAGAERVVQPGRHPHRHRQLGRDGEGVGRADGHAPARTQRGTRARSSARRSARTAPASSPAVGTDRRRRCGTRGRARPCSTSKGTRRVSVSFSPDGTRIVTGSSDGTAKVWDARTGAPLLDLKGHTGWWYSASFSPDGTRIVTGSRTRRRRCGTRGRAPPCSSSTGHSRAGDERVVQPRRHPHRHRQ